MPYRSVWEAHGVLTTWEGCATGEEFIDFIKKGQADPSFDELRYSLHDFTACTSTDFSLASIEELAALDSAGALTNSRIKIGVVTNREDVRSKVRDYLGTELSPYPVRIFPSIDEARNWVST
jgi:hypothetical protein